MPKDAESVRVGYLLPSISHLARQLASEADDSSSGDSSKEVVV